ncbi:MAG: ribose-phosphate pyrophosphokinase [Chloroflexota bacterium]
MTGNTSSELHDKLRIFSCHSNPNLAVRICEYLDIPLSELEISRFSNDNLHVQILENVRERDVFVIQSFSEPVSTHILELFITLDALRSASARRVTAVIPYYSYARSDKKDAPRISITGRLMADLLKTAGADRVLTMDLHSDQVQGFFSMPVDNLTARPIIADYFRQNLDLSNVVIVATDAGGAKRAGKFALLLDCPLAIIDKRRISDTSVHQGSVVGDVAGKDVVIFEDEISTGTTVATSVQTVLTAGARRVHVGATHGILCGPAIEKLGVAPIESIVLADSVHIPGGKRLPNVTICSVAPLMAEAIRRIHTGESVGELFI